MSISHSQKSPPSGLPPDQAIERLSRYPAHLRLADRYRIIVELAKHVQREGGHLYLVGGAVRDELLERAPTDFDLELHGLDVPAVEQLLSEFGTVQLTGKHFGTYKLQSGVGGIEIALPRRDSQHGPRHNDLSVEIQPHLGITEAARRREYTIGAMYKDVLSGEIIDPFHGYDDLKAGVLRLIDPVRFRDDALRVFRGARQAARFQLLVEPRTLEAMSSMVEQLGALPNDRLREEWTLLLTQPERPSIGLRLLYDLGVFQRWYPELQRLWSTPQDSSRHPEGSAGEHAALVVDAMAVLLRHHQTDSRRRIEGLLAALVHDFGKPHTTVQEDRQITARGHEEAGAEPAARFLRSIGIAEAAIRRIAALVTHHAIPAAMYRDRSSLNDRSLRLLAREIGPTQLWTLLLLTEADHQGRGPFQTQDGTLAHPDTSGYHRWWTEVVTRLDLDVEPEPLVSGRELVVDRSAAGWRQGEVIGQAQHLIEELRVFGKTRDEILSVIDDADSPAEAIEALQALLHQVSE